MQARVTSQLEAAGKVLQVVSNLKLYTGEDVEVGWLTDGAPAPAAAPIVIYQDLLAFDEETLLLLDDGGLDHRHTSELADALRDPSLLTRLIPAPRGLVLCRFRNLEKEFATPRDNATPLEVYAAATFNVEMNEQSQQTHLLYRDGERTALISCPEVLDPITQLLPSTAEQNEQYIRPKRHAFDDRDGTGERITPEDIDYAAAQRAQLGTLTSYARVLVMLWGLHDRTSLLETTAIPKLSNWLDPAFQLSHLSLVSQDSMLAETRESYAVFRDRHNAYLASGTTVAIDTHQAINADTAPGLYGNPTWNRYQSAYTANRLYQVSCDRVAIAPVRSDGARPYVELEATYDGYRDVRRDRIKAKVYLTPDHAAHYLVLDRVHGADLDYYLMSRRQRKAYASYVPLFQAARTFVRGRDATEAALRDRLRRAVVEAKVPHDPDALDGAITEALASVRATQRGSLRDTAATRTRLLNTLHASLTHAGARIVAAEGFAAAHGRIPLRLAHQGSDEWTLYATSLEDEHDPRLPVHRWVAAIVLAFDTRGAVTPRGNVRQVLLRARGGEVIVHDWPEAASKKARHDRVEFAQYRSTLARIGARSDGYMAAPDLAAACYAMGRTAIEKSRRFISEAFAAIPVGTALRSDIRRDADRFALAYKGPWIVIAYGNAMDVAYRLGDAEMKTRCRSLIARWYTDPARRLARFDALDDDAGQRVLQPGAMPYAAFAASARQTVIVNPDAHGIGDVRWVVPSWGTQAELRHAYPKRELVYRLTSLSAAGAHYFPDLILHCERSTDAFFE
jgi:hypothetical protein